VKALRKPSLSTWATNQLTRTNELDVQRLLKAGEQLRATQLEADAPDAFAEARAEERRAIDRLVQASAEILASAGHAAADATLNRVATNLRTAAVTDEGRTLLKRGRLTEDLEASGFEAFAGLTLPAPRPRGERAAPAPAAEGRDPARERRLAAARAKAEQAREEADELERRATAAERARDEAKRELARAEREAERLRARAAKAAERAERAERELGESG
jgi:hypothetical protein